LAGKLHGVIRLNKWGVDQARRRLGELLRQLDDLEGRARRLERELGDEQKAAAVAPVEGGRLYGAYARWVIARRAEIARAVAKKEQEVAVAREQLREAYRELKKYEVAEAVRERRLALALARREQAELDEIGTQGFLHRRR
jgi:flagellar export protein FliJ